METYYGGSLIHIYKCPNHQNEDWGTGGVTSAFDKVPHCVPCELLKLRNENKKLLEELEAVNYCCVHLRDEIKELKKELNEKGWVIPKE